MNLWTQVRRAVLVGGMSKAEAQRRFGLSESTLNKMLFHPEPPGYRMSRPREKPLLGPFLPIIREILAADKKAPPKQRHTIKRIIERLQQEFGYTGKKTAVYDAVAEIKKSNKDVFVPLKHPPGEAQFDFGFAHAKVCGTLTKIAYAELSLPYSNVRYFQVFPAECTETFQEGLKRSFRFLGGVPALIKFDNSKIAVRNIIKQRGGEPTKEFLRIVSHFLFAYRFCRVRQPQEKGHVEGAVKYSRSNHLVPVPEFESFEEFNTLLEERCREDMKKTSAKRTRPVEEHFEEEKKCLLPLPEVEFEARRTENRKVDSLSLVHFHRNEYSVPSRYAHHEVAVVGGVDTVRILVGDEIVAEHRRDWGEKNTHYHPVHYLAITERRPNSLDFGKPFENWDLPNEFDVLRRRLEYRAKKQGKRGENSGTIEEEHLDR